MIGSRPPGWFRIVAAIALLWNLLGVAIYLNNAGLFGDPLAGLDEAERALAATIPTWVTGAHAVAVFAGTLGVIGLIMLKRWARPVLILSLLGILGQCGWILLVSDAAAVHGPSVMAISGAVIVIGLLLVWLANIGVRRGWLK